MIITDIERLREISSEFKGSAKELEDLFNLLDKELKDSKIPGCGLAAIQIDIPIRACIIRSKTLDLNIYNPIIISMSNLFTFKGEGCLSIPNIFKDTTRFKEITFRNGDGKIYNLKGFDSVVVQHEVGHMDGELFLDFLSENGGI